MKKRLKIIALVMASVLFISGAVFFVTYKSDFVYIGFEYFARLTRNYKLPQANVEGLSFSSYTLEQLSTRGDVTIDDSAMLINGQYTIPADVKPELVPYGDKQINACMLEALTLMDQHIYELYGESLSVVSAYRSADHQQDVISTSKGDTAAAVGASEHQFGLGIDVGVEGYGGRSFLKTPTGRHVNNHCYKYGFIIRYPLCSFDVTGITYEPWHIRYVGVPHAEIIYKSGMVLEEYIESLSIGDWYEYGGYLISRQHPEAIVLPDHFASCTVSLDNTGYCLVTVEPMVAEFD
ncbi:MAG: M15 family metallopeptidase [Clostridia bacterium]|nr:M15 family metallopeptidase [Clostridia bacterium]